MPIYSPSYVEQLEASAWSLTCLQQDKGLKQVAKTRHTKPCLKRAEGQRKLLWSRSLLIKRAEKVVESKVKALPSCNMVVWDPEAFGFAVRKLSRIVIQTSDIVFLSLAWVWRYKKPRTGIFILYRNKDSNHSVNHGYTALLYTYGVLLVQMFGWEEITDQTEVALLKTIKLLSWGLFKMEWGKWSILSSHKIQISLNVLVYNPPFSLIRATSHCGAGRADVLHDHTVTYTAFQQRCPG